MRTYTAMFDSRSDAEMARTELMRDGLVSADAIDLHDQASSFSSGSQGADESRDKGFWAGVKDFFLPDDDRQVYEEGMRRGGCVLTVHVGDDQADRVERMLESSNAVDVDAREAEWRGSGWTPGSSSSGYGSGADFGASGMTGTSMAGAGMAGSGMTGAGSTTETTFERETYSGGDTGFGSSGRYEQTGLGDGGDTGMGLGDGMTGDRGSSTEMAIPVVEERLVVGKREVNRGGVRVRSYVREIPVSEQVSLREEHVEVERRPVDQPLTGSAAVTGQMGARLDDDAFQERTIELVETSEEAVVGKQARVVEEVVVRKDVDQRIEEITDTVRRTDVDIERLPDDRMGGVGTDADRRDI